MVERRDVVVAGAGPVGLGLALGLARQGVDVLVLEKESGTAKHSRAPAIWPRTQEILAELGIVDRFVECSVARLISVPLAQEQFDALVSFTFNLGGGALQASTLRRVINRGDHARAPDEIRRWVYAGGRKLAGLVRRREAEALLYEAGTDALLAPPRKPLLARLRRAA